MSIFPEDKHLEVFIKPNSSGPSSDSTPIFVQALVVSIPISIAMSLSLIEEIPIIINPNPPEVPAVGTGTLGTENPLPQPPLPPGNGTGSLNSPNGATVSNTLLRPYTILIPQFCNGSAIAGASFQSEPTSASTATKGIVAVGNEVTLTGATAYGDGIIWFQAVNEIALTPSDQPEAQNQTEPYQIGWISDCLIRGSGYF